MSWLPLPSAHPGAINRQWKTEPGGEVTIHATQDVTPIIEQNKAMQTRDMPSRKMRSMEPVASIPLVVIEQWGRELGFPVFSLPPAERRAFITKKLRCGDWRHMKTTSERL